MHQIYRAFRRRLQGLETAGRILVRLRFGSAPEAVEGHAISGALAANVFGGCRV